MIQLPSNTNRAWTTAKYQYNFAPRGRGNVLLGGVIIDFKFLIFILLALVAVGMALTLWSLALYRKKGMQKRHLSDWCVLAPTPVPYSAGILWPSTSMSVQWTVNFFCIRDQQYFQLKHKLYRLLSQTSRFLRWSSVDGGIAPLVFTAYLQNQSTTPDRASYGGSKATSFRYIQHQMKCLRGRSDEVEANVAFVNAAVMSDPLVYLRMIFGNGASTDLAHYQSLLRPNRVVLLPVVVVGEHNEYTAGLRMLRRVRATELSWPELVQCG